MANSRSTQQGRSTGIIDNVWGRRLLAALLLLLVTVLMQGPRLDLPFGPAENSGDFYGKFSQVWQRFGFLELRGLPLGRLYADSIDRTSPYLNHPPGFLWLEGAFGTEEWQLRLPTVLGGWLAAVLLFELLRRSFGAPAALGASLLLLVTPMVSLLAQTSYENVVLPAGLLLFLAAWRGLDEHPHKRRWKVLLVLTAFVGPWLDWAFLFFCAGLVPLMWCPSSLRQTLRRLVLPAAVSTVSLALVFVWKYWAVKAPGLPPLPEAPGLADLVDITIYRRPELTYFLARSAWRLERGWTMYLLLIAPIGLWSLWRRAPRLTLALSVPGLGFPLLFASHATLHETFFAYLTPVAAASALAVILDLPKVRPAVRTLLAAILIVSVTVESYRWFDFANSTFLADLGAELSAATAASEDEGAQFAVFHNSPLYYSYYVRVPNVLMPPVRYPELVKAAVARTDPSQGVRFLWLRYEPVTHPLAPLWRSDDQLRDMLVHLPRKNIPRLTRTLNDEHGEPRLRVTEAWLVTLREPQ